MRVDKWTRLACGLGLVLLVAAQEKVWPWLVEVPPAPRQDARAPSVPAAPADDDHAGEPEKKAKPPLPHVVPDAPVPRWPAGWAEGTARDTLSVRDGVVSRGPRAGGHPHAPVGDFHRARATWRALAGDAPAPDVAACPAEPMPDRVLSTCIRRTGPPHA